MKRTMMRYLFAAISGTTCCAAGAWLAAGELSLELLMMSGIVGVISPPLLFWMLRGEITGSTEGR